MQPEALLPSLYHGYKSLQHIIDTLKKRIEIEKDYYNQLESWRLSAQDGPQMIETTETTDALGSAFHLLLKNSHEGTLRISPNNRVPTLPDVFSKDEAFGAHLKYASTTITALKGSIEKIDDRANRLRKYEIMTEEARTNAKIQYDHWQRRQSELNRQSKSSLISMKRRLKRNDSDGLEGYEQADATLRKRVSRLNADRAFFRDYILGKIDSLSLQYQEAVDAIGKTLHLFARNQHKIAYQSSIHGAGVVNSASGILGSDLAKTLHNELASESRAIQVPEAEYHSLEFHRGDVKPIPQRLIFGFDLPSSDFSAGPSVHVVISVFRDLVNYISEERAWDWYIKRSDNSPNLDRDTWARVKYDLETKWSGRRQRDRELLDSFGSEACASLVKALLSSLPYPLLACDEDLAQTLEDLRTKRRTDSAVDSGSSSHLWASTGGTTRLPGSHFAAIMTLLQPIHNRPGGELMRVLCKSLAPYFSRASSDTKRALSVTFSMLLTRRAGCLDLLFPSLVLHYDKYIGQLENRKSNARSTVMSSPAEGVHVIDPPSATRTFQFNGVPPPLQAPTLPPNRFPASRLLNVDSENHLFRTASSAPANDNYTPTVAPPAIWYSRLRFPRRFRGQPPGSQVSRPTQ